MLQKEDNPFRTNLEAAVAYLIGKGIIKKDMDVVEALEMSKGTFSAYKTGKTEPSKNFIRQFENYYNLRLSDFDIDSNHLGEHNPGYETNEAVSNVDILNLYQQQVSIQKRILDSLEEMKVNLGQLMTDVQGLHHPVGTAGRRTERVPLGKKKNKTPSKDNPDNK